MQKAAAVVPLALLSAAWTASLTSAATPAANVTAASPEQGGGVLPDGSSVPAEAVEAHRDLITGETLTTELRVELREEAVAPDTAVAVGAGSALTVEVRRA